VNPRTAVNAVTKTNTLNLLPVLFLIFTMILLFL
jgi:hypothetical protein